MQNFTTHIYFKINWERSNLEQEDDEIVHAQALPEESSRVANIVTS